MRPVFQPLKRPSQETDNLQTCICELPGLESGETPVTIVTDKYQDFVLHLNLYSKALCISGKSLVALILSDVCVRVSPGPFLPKSILLFLGFTSPPKHLQAHQY